MNYRGKRSSWYNEFSQCVDKDPSWKTLYHYMHFKQLAAADNGSFWPRICTSICVLGNPRTGGVRSCSLYSGIVLRFKGKGSMCPMILLAQDWAMRLVAKRNLVCLVFAGWFRVKPLAIPFPFRLPPYPKPYKAADAAAALLPLCRRGLQHRHAAEGHRTPGHGAPGRKGLGFGLGRV